MGGLCGEVDVGGNRDELFLVWGCEFEHRHVAFVGEGEEVPVVDGQGLEGRAGGDQVQLVAVWELADSVDVDPFLIAYEQSVVGRLETQTVGFVQFVRGLDQFLPVDAVDMQFSLLCLSQEVEFGPGGVMCAVDAPHEFYEVELSEGGVRFLRPGVEFIFWGGRGRLRFWW